MATLDDLRDRIIRETNREELLDAPGSDPTAANSDTLDLCIGQAIKFYADTRFSFNEGTVSLTTVAGGDLVPWPDGLRKIDRLSYSQTGTQRYGMRLRDYQTIDAWQGYGGSSGQPNDYAISDDYIRIYPTPDRAYPLTVIGIIDLPTNFEDGQTTNAWTNEAQDLIAARTRYLLCRDYFRDNEGAAIANAAEREALADLLGKTMNKIATGRVRGSW